MPGCRRRRWASPRRPGWSRRCASWRRALHGSGWPHRFGPRRWPAVPDAVRAPLPELVIGCGGVAAAVGAALRRGGRPVVQVQHPRMDPRRFDLVVVNRHDELTGPNVVVTRTALHRVTPARLAAAAEQWRARLAHLKRPLVAVMVGGSNGRFRLDAGVGGALAGRLAAHDAQGWRGRRGHPLAAHRSGGDAACWPRRWLRSAAMSGTARRQSVFRHAGAGRRDRRDDGQRVHGIRGGGDRGAGDAGAHCPAGRAATACSSSRCSPKGGCANSPDAAKSGRWRRSTTRRRPAGEVRRRLGL